MWLYSHVYTGCISQCDFDEPDNFCGWTTKVSDPALFGWIFWNGQTDTPGTGPSDDFSKPGCKNFCFLNFITLSYWYCFLYFKFCFSYILFKFDKSTQSAL